MLSIYAYFRFRPDDGHSNTQVTGVPTVMAMRLAILSLAWLSIPSAAAAQQVWRTTGEPIVNRILMLAPREYQQQLRQAQEAIEREQYSEAIQSLSQLMQPESRIDDGFDESVQEDFFIGRPGDNQLRSSLRTEARRLLGQLPARGLELYRLNYGAEAQRLLDQALDGRDESLLAEVAWRFFHTEAGYKANMLLGRHHLDRGRPLAASMCFDRLSESDLAVAKFDPELSLLLAASWRQAGHSEKAANVLADLKRRLPATTFTIDNETVPLFSSDEDPLDWLHRKLPIARADESQRPIGWHMHRGAPSRNVALTGGMPLMRHRWRVPVASTPDDEELISMVATDHAERGSTAIASVTPLIVDDVILLRSPDNLLAVDFQTGKRVWEYPWAAPPRSIDAASPRPARNRQQRRHQLEERLWLDATYGQISSDGKLVFLIDGLNYVGPSAMDANAQVIRNIRARDPDRTRDHNMLVALEISTQGKYRWRIGGMTGEDEPALARAFFLGPPLVLADSLYILAEVRGDVSLFVLDADSGHLKWSQQLAHVGIVNIVEDVARRLAGATPSYSDGVLVCPTSAGAIVAVDIPTRSLLWGYQYPRSFLINPGTVRLNFARTRSTSRHDSSDRWLDSSPLIADGRVIMTPAEANEMTCLDLLTGKPIWSVSRDRDLLMAACVYKGQVVVVGNSKVVAYGIEDGKTLWQVNVDDASNAMAPRQRPTGRGFLVDNRFFLPTTARMLVIDLDQGELEQAVPLSATLGSLIPYKDQIVSLSPEALTTYYQIDRLEETVKERLSNDTADPWALEHQGLVELERGDRGSALASFRSAYQHCAEDDDRREGTRAMLVETLLAVLEQDDEADDQIIREVDGLIERPLQRERYLRLMGRRMLKNGRATEAFRSFLELAHQQGTPSHPSVLDDARLPLIDTGGRKHFVRRDRYVRSGIREALRIADDAERQALEVLIETEQLDALASDRISRLHEFLRIFSDHALADPVRLELARRYLQVGELIRVEQLILPLVESGRSDASGDGWLMLAKTMRMGGRPELFGQCLDMLATEWSSRPLSDGRTGLEWADELRENWTATSNPPPLAAWPYGRVHVERLRGSRATLPTGFQAYSNYRPIEQRENRGALLARLQVTYDATGTNSIVISDSFGRERIRIPGTNGRIKRFVDGTLTAKTLGHLVFVNFGHGVLAANALQDRQPNDQHVMWPKSYAELLDAVDRPRQTRMTVTTRTNMWGQQETAVRNRRVHCIGPATYDGLVYLQGNSLYCVDPVRGHPLWIRHDVPAGSDVWGDEHHVLVAPPTKSKNRVARVFQLLDGEELDAVDVPPVESIWSTVGRFVLTSDTLKQDGTSLQRLWLLDPMTQETIWHHSFPEGTRGHLTLDEELAFATPESRFLLIDARTGTVELEHALEEYDRPLLSVYWRTSPDQSLLIRRFEPQAKAGTRIKSFRDNDASCPLIDGDIYAFHRPSGQLQWPVPAVIEGYSLPLDQPADVPVLAFVRRISGSNSRSRGRATLSLLCIDKRDGRLLLEEDGLNFSFGSFVMMGDSVQHTVSIRLLNVHNYLLRFSDEPQPPEPPAQIGSTAGGQKGSGLSNWMGAVIDALGRPLKGTGGTRPREGAAKDEKPADPGPLKKEPEK